MEGFEWDEDKNLANQRKHGISFEEASAIFDGPVLSHEDEHHSETRERSYGLLGANVVVCVIHTDRNGSTRIISARKATKNERKLFDVYLRKTAG
jgi:uncharacterized DUF497 family protein